MKTKIFKILIITATFACATINSAYATQDGDNDEAQTSSRGMKQAADDQGLAHRVNNVLSGQIPKGSFTITSYNSKILLAGQVPTESDKTKAQIAVTKTADVKGVWNYLSVEPNEDASAISKDAYLTSAAKASLIAQKGVNANNIKVVTSNGVVYLLGTKPGKTHQVNAAINDIKQMADVKKVVNLINK